MATTRSMMQLYVEQIVDTQVLQIFPLFEEVFIFLNPTKRTVVAEITSESVGGIVSSKDAGLSTVALSSDAFTQLRLLFNQRGREEHFYAPSHVASPEITGAVGAGLSVMQIGFDSSGPGTLTVGRAIGAHAYIDQID